MFCLDPRKVLPDDIQMATLIGRAFISDNPGGPSVILIRDGEVLDISNVAPTVSEFCNNKPLVNSINGNSIGSFEAVLSNSPFHSRNMGKPYFLAPIDLQAIKAAGVTFVSSLLERVIEERANGNPIVAEEIRTELSLTIGTDLSTIVPGSKESQKLKDWLLRRNLWSQYLEVGIGPDAEIFTKAQPMSAVGIGAHIGIHPRSVWNNPEPEIVLVVNNYGEVVGVTLGNDVNLRDFEGRSALLLGRAKDNNGSCAVGPFIRLFDDNFTLEDVRHCVLSLHIEGEDGFELNWQSSLSSISRTFEDLVSQTISPTNSYPDGLVLFTGTMFAATEDRDKEGSGFHHKVGDLVTIHNPKLGSLVNLVGHADRIPKWEFGAGKLIRNIAERGLI